MIRLIIKIFLISAATISFTSGKSQKLNFSIEEGPLFKAPKRSIPIDFIGCNENDFYLLYARGKFGSGSRTLMKFDLDMNFSGSLSLGSDTEKYRSESTDAVLVGYKMGHSILKTSFNPDFQDESGMGIDDPQIINKEVYFELIDYENLQSKESILLSKITPEEEAAKDLQFLFSPDSNFSALIYSDDAIGTSITKYHIFNKSLSL